MTYENLFVQKLKVEKYFVLRGETEAVCDLKCNSKIRETISSSEKPYFLGEPKTHWKVMIMIISGFRWILFLIA